MKMKVRYPGFRNGTRLKLLDAARVLNALGETDLAMEVATATARFDGRVAELRETGRGSGLRGRL